MGDIKKRAGWYALSMGRKEQIRRFRRSFPAALRRVFLFPGVRPCFTSAGPEPFFHATFPALPRSIQEANHGLSYHLSYRRHRVQGEIELQSGRFEARGCLAVRQLPALPRPAPQREAGGSGVQRRRFRIQPRRRRGETGGLPPDRFERGVRQSHEGAGHRAGGSLCRADGTGENRL